MRYLPENASENIFVMPYAILIDEVRNIITRKRVESLDWLDLAQYGFTIAVIVVDIMTFSSLVAGDWMLFWSMILARLVLYAACLFVGLAYVAQQEIDEVQYLDGYY